MNSFLPLDIVFHKIIKVKSDAHARFSAINRTYQYRITTKKNPFLSDFSHYYHGKLDLAVMNIGASILLDVSDFTSFSKLHGNTKTNICKLTKAEWQKKDDLLIFTISANRFLRNMVRAITGTLLDVGKGKISIEKFKEIIESKNRCNASTSVPAKGLFLTGIEYSNQIFFD
jgi:tRNA pseudouridine38-40 synthase